MILTSYSKPNSFQEAIEPILDLIDQSLGFENVPIRSRPLKAATNLVKTFISEVRLGDDKPQKPEEITDFSFSPWFKLIFASVEIWYQTRYGTRMTTSEKGMRGIITIANTLFEIRVPITTSQVEVVGQTAWLSFPDKLLPDENVHKWIVNPPNWSTYSDELRRESDEGMSEIAILLRRISCRMTGADVSDPKARNVLAGVKVHLHSAVALICREGEEGSYARAQWELQMACESAYKGLLQQKTGTFPEKHDLFLIHDLANLPEKSVKRQWLIDLPRWNEAANLRYGIGDHPTTVGIFFWYKLTLKIIAGVFENLNGINLSEASVLMKIPPWLDKSLDGEGVIQKEN